MNKFKYFVNFKFGCLVVSQTKNNWSIINHCENFGYTEISRKHFKFILKVYTPAARPQRSSIIKGHSNRYATFYIKS